MISQKSTFMILIKGFGFVKVDIPIVNTIKSWEWFPLWVKWNRCREIRYLCFWMSARDNVSKLYIENLSMTRPITLYWHNLRDVELIMSTLLLHSSTKAPDM